VVRRDQGSTVKSYEIYRSTNAFTDVSEADLIAAGVTDTLTAISPQETPIPLPGSRAEFRGSFGALSSEAISIADGESPSLVSA
jgi:hypothetical protein